MIRRSIPTEWKLFVFFWSSIHILWGKKERVSAKESKPFDLKQYRLTIHLENKKKIGQGLLEMD